MTNYEERTNAYEESAAGAFDREEWIAQKKAEREQAYEMISQMCTMITIDGERYKNCLDLISRFGKYSPSNILLLAAQKPDAKRLADFKSWKEAHVSIKKGESGIIILEPGKEFTGKDGKTIRPFNAKKVFDVSQTSLPFAVEPSVKRDGKLLLRALIHHAPCRFRFADASDMPAGVGARFIERDNTIYVTRGPETDASFRWIAKELATAHLKKDGYDPELADFAAVSIGYIIAARNGIDTATYDFTKLPANLEKLDEARVKQMVSKIREVSNTITNDMQQLFDQHRDDQSRDDAR